MRLEDLRRPGVQERERAAAFRQIQGGRVNITSADLAKIQAPTCLIHGRDERFFFSKETAPILIEAAVKTCFVIPNASCAILAGCGHWPQIEKANTFNVLALEFLQRADSRAHLDSGDPGPRSSVTGSSHPTANRREG